MQLAASQTSSQIFCSRVLHRTACLLWRRLGKVWQSSHPSSEQTATICKIVRVTHRRKPIQERVAIKWEKRRPVPGYAESFREAFVDYIRGAPANHTSERKQSAHPGAIRDSKVSQT